MRSLQTPLSSYICSYSRRTYITSFCLIVLCLPIARIYNKTSNGLSFHHFWYNAGTHLNPYNDTNIFQEFEKLRAPQHQNQTDKYSSTITKPKSKPSIVFCHIGNSLKYGKHLLHSVRQARLFNPQSKIFLISQSKVFLENSNSRIVFQRLNQNDPRGSPLRQW